MLFSLTVTLWIIFHDSFYKKNAPICESLGHTICLAKVVLAHFSFDCEEATYLAKVFLAHFSLVWEARAGRLYIWPLLMKRRTPCGVPVLASHYTVGQNLSCTTESDNDEISACTVNWADSWLSLGCRIIVFNQSNTQRAAWGNFVVRKYHPSVSTITSVGWGFNWSLFFRRMLMRMIWLGCGVAG